ncbi:hypothetical protein PoB_000028800 [Plakobranchus ocellatus]|uniref:Uncharacterized protein n=1 Tax=Plakobranchus ocellatus TaxID=259542 RepID=A0AAV3XTS7_9GAST|nr:hypothetical protein PoB_000028800 [Plakobranchus ocellatus]
MLVILAFWPSLGRKRVSSLWKIYVDSKASDLNPTVTGLWIISQAENMHRYACPASSKRWQGFSSSSSSTGPRSCSHLLRFGMGSLKPVSSMPCQDIQAGKPGSIRGPGLDVGVGFLWWRS